MTVQHLLPTYLNRPIGADLRRAERLLASGDAQAGALVACVALERRLRSVRSLYSLSGLRAVAVALRAENIITKKQFTRLRWISVQRNALMHGRIDSDVIAASIVRQVIAFVAEVEARREN